MFRQLRTSREKIRAGHWPSFAAPIGNLKAFVAAAVTVFAVLVAGVSISTWLAVRARRAENAAVEARDRAVQAESKTATERDAARNARNDAVTARALAQQERDTAVTEKERADTEAVFSGT